MPTVHTSLPNPIYQLEITLLDTKPSIWRRVLVPADLSLAYLHLVVQGAMGWENSHLHEFRAGRERYGVPETEDGFPGEEPCRDERKVAVREVLPETGATLQYTYDFGDSWEHRIRLEKIVEPEPGIVYPVCTGGELHCPPEDCGGIPGYFEFLHAISDPRHPEHKEMLKWVGGSFDPRSFSPDDANQLLKKLEKKFRPVAKKPATRKASKTKSTVASSKEMDRLIASLTVELTKPKELKKRVGPDKTVPFELNAAERALILNDTFAPDELTERLRVAIKPNEPPIYTYTLADLDELAGYIAAEANHTKNKKKENALQEIFDRMTLVIESYAAKGE